MAVWPSVVIAMVARVVAREQTPVERLVDSREAHWGVLVVLGAVQSPPCQGAVWGQPGGPRAAIHKVLRRVVLRV
jgi:hypothetical protein